MMGLIGRKIGMTSIFTKDGNFISVTVIEVLENRVTQIKSLTNDGYFAIQVTTGVKKSSHVTKSEAGHFAKAGVEAGRRLCEFRLNKNENFFVGQSINIDFFSKINKVDITGISKGKGFSGTVKRWHFRTQDATHGNSLSHRAPGSTGQNQTPGRVFKRKKMAGQLGTKRVTIQNLSVVRVDTHHNLLLVHGVVPGAVNSDLMIKLVVKK